MMKRQMYRGGGLGAVPREQYGLGSFLKKTFKKVTKPFVKVAQKLVPKEIAKPLMVAAPFLGPYAPLIYAAGSAKATGGIDPMKLALTAAPYVKFEGIKPVGYGGSKYGMFGGEEVGFGKRAPGETFGSMDSPTGIETAPGDLRGTSLAQKIDEGASKQFDALAKGKDTASIKEVAIDTITSPTTLISGGVSLAQYIDAKKKENEDKGIEFTEEDYNNAVNEYYAQYSEGFDRGFGQTGGIAQTREKYGNGSGPSGNRLKQLYTLREEAMEKGDDDKVVELDQEIGLILKKYATGGRVQLAEGSDDPEYGTKEYYKKNLDVLNLDELIEKPHLLNSFTIGLIEERINEYGEAGGDISPYMEKYNTAKQKNAEYFQSLNEEQQQNYLKRNTEMLEKDLNMGIFPNQENLGILSIEKETDSGNKIPAPKKDIFDIEGFKQYRMDVATGGRIGYAEGMDDPEKSQMALDMFGKDIRLLDQDEMDMLDEEYNIKKGIVELAKGGRVKLASGTAEPQNMVSPITEFKKNIGNAIMGIRGGMDQSIVVDMLENKRIQMGIPEEDAKVAVTDFMSSFQGIQ